MLVNFLICGTQKSGTTALDKYLRKHPQICMAREKEVHFFDNDNNFNQAEPNYSLYHSFFDNVDNDSLVGEATPIYMYWKEAPKRIVNYNPDMKLIIILRNPTERAYSHWNMERLRKKEVRTFSAAIKEEIVNINANLTLHQNRVFSYVDRGFYYKQLVNLKRHFSMKKILIIKHDSLMHNLPSTLNKIFLFLNIDTDIVINPISEHVLPYLVPINQDDRMKLNALYKDDILKLENELGWDCNNWSN